MNVIFGDNFERANGPIGNGWNEYGGTPQIVGGEVCQVNVNAITRLSPDIHPYSAVRADFRALSLADVNAGVLINANNTQGAYPIEFSAVADSGGVLLKLNTTGTGSIGLCGQIWLPSFAWDGFALGLEYDGAEIRALYGESVVLRKPFTGFLSQVYYGFRAANAQTFCKNFSAGLCESWDVTVEVAEVSSPGGEALLRFTGVGTHWTPGTPGSPIFTAGIGSIHDQEVTTETSAVAYYTPPAIPSGDTIIDSGGALVKTIRLNTYPEAVGGGGGEPTGDLSSIISILTGGSGDAVGTSGLFDKFLQFLDLGLGTTRTNLDRLCTMIERLLAQGVDGEDIRGLIENINRTSASSMTQLEALTGEGAMDLVDLSTEIRGPGSRSVGEVYDKLPELASATNLLSLMGTVGMLVTSNGYTLEHVRQWINGAVMGDPDLGGVLNAINDARISTQGTVNSAEGSINGTVNAAHIITDGLIAALGASMATAEALDAPFRTATAASLLAQAGTLAGIVADLATLKESVPTVNVDLSQVLAKIDQTNSAVEAVQDDLTAQIAALSSRIAAVETAISRRTRPLWPGNGQLVFGQTVTIEGEGTVYGPMDGVRIEVLAAPGEIGHQSFNGSTRYLYLGKLAFIGPNGAYDEEQQIRWKSGTYSPLNACTADLVSIKCRPGTTLSIQPWSHASS